MSTKPVRPREIYVSSTTYEALGVIGQTIDRTRDEIAEVALQAYLNQEWPQVMKFIQDRDKQREVFESELKQKFKPQTT